MLFLRLIILLLGITSIVTGCTKNSTGPQFNFEEDNPNAYEQVQTDFVNYLRSKLVELYKVMSTYGDNIAKAKGVLKIASEFEILVFGPPRSGKSTLIKEISGDETIETSAGMNACTSKPQEYVDKYGIHWWDTPGVEKWNIEDAENFLKEKFYDRKILPKVAIFCRTANAFAPTEVVQFMFDEFKKHGILLLFVIPKWPFIPKSEQDSIFQEAVSLLGGKATPIYGRASKGYKAYECEPKKSYIIPVNSKEDTILGMTVKVSNINTLRKILVTKLDKESQGKLVELYKDNLGFWNKLGYGAIEILDDLGLNTAEVILTEEERKIYENVKDGDERIKNIKLIFKIVDKILRGNQ